MLRRPPTTLSLTAEDVASYEDRRYAQQQAHLQAMNDTNNILRPKAMSGHHGNAIPMETSSASSTDEAMEDVSARLAEREQERERERELELGEHAPREGGVEEFEHSDEDDEEDDDDDDDDDPFTTLPRSVAGPRAVSPGAQRGAFLRQQRGRGAHQGHARSQSHSTSIPTYTSATAATARSRIMGSTSASALPPPVVPGLGIAQPAPVPAHLQQTPVHSTSQPGIATRAGAGAGGRGGGSRQTSEPPPAPARVRTHAERIGIAGPSTRSGDIGTGTGSTSTAGPGTRRRTPRQAQLASLYMAPSTPPRLGHTATARDVWTGADFDIHEDDVAEGNGDHESTDEESGESGEAGDHDNSGTTDGGSVYVGDLQVVEPSFEESVATGSPMPSAQRRRLLRLHHGDPSIGPDPGPDDSMDLD
ncbi:hypothetical protein F5Y18DRAFT_432745 [Xylariaceae sp. FL1019]|nr:hypothetical protein F5Y18DRAFT_432745 [Xylariaceae sp. FL1019]